MNIEINEKLKTLPDKSGVYIMKNEAGEIIYVGKAKNLKNRVRSYFKSHNHPPKVSSMIENVNSFEYIITDTELEALVLEKNLIKQNMPKYNILLKDDKTYPFMKITLNEPYPRVLLTRKILKDGAAYFGPYQSSYDLKHLISLINDVFSLRTCKTEFDETFEKKRPCLYYQLGKCCGVCAHMIDKENYRKIINDVISFVKGNSSEVIKKLYDEMKIASNSFDFEKAAVCRDRLKAIEALEDKQKIVNPKGNDFDAVALYNRNNFCCVQVFFVRNGKIVGREHYFINDTEGIEASKILSEFMRCYYENSSFIPPIIYTECEVEDYEVLEEWISDKSNFSVKIKVPKIGDNAKLIRMIQTNAKKEHSDYELKILRDISFKNSAITQLQTLLELKNPPFLIEAYDISNSGNDFAVGSMVVYKEGKPCQRRYRNFKIKNISGQDDYGSMREVFARRIQRALNEERDIKEMKITLEEASFLPLPDVFFADGGEGHRNAVKEVLDEYGIDVPIFGIVKDDNHKTRGLVGENGFIPVDLKSDVFMLLTNIQDEMHRRAITHLRNTQKSGVQKSELDNIRGVGEKRKKILISYFKSVTKIKNASYDELKGVKGIDEATAHNVFEYFHNREK